jgi:hypothetical protein
MGTRILPVLAAILLCGGGVAQAAQSLLGATSAEALHAVRERRAYWGLGRLTIRHKWFGHPWIQAEVLDDGRVVSHLRVDPATGRFLAKDEPATGEGDIRDLTTLRPIVERSLHRLEIGNWMWPTESGQAWGVSLLYEGRVVGTLKVDGRRGLLQQAEDD